MPFDEAFTMGPFSVDAAGRLCPARDDLFPGFSVRWRGRIVHARLAREVSGSGRLFIQSDLGRIPSTASDPASRVACLRLLRGLMTELPAAWVLRLLPTHQPRLETESPIGLPVTVTDLVTELTAFLLDLSPVLDLMDHAGISPVNA